MAEIIRYVNPASAAGGDGTTSATSGATRAYSTLSECEANEQADFVTNTDNLVVNCAGATVDNTACTWDGSITDATYDIQIIGDLVDGIYSSSYYRLEPTTQPSTVGGMEIADPFVTLDSIQVKNTYTGDSTNRFGVRVGVTDFTIKKSIIKGTDTGLGSTGLSFATAGATGANCENVFIYDFPNVGVRNGSANGGIDNNFSYITVINCGTGFYGNASYKDLGICKNCVAIACTTGWTTTWNSSSSNNASNDVTHPGTSGVTLTTNVITDYLQSASDLHIDNTATYASELSGAGTNVAGITVDIDGDTRDGSTPDIGADELVAAAVGGRIMSSLVNFGGLASRGGIAGSGGGLAA